MNTLRLLPLLLLLACGPKRPVHGGIDLRAFVTEVEILVENGSWNDLIARCEPLHRQAQLKDLGMSRAQYVSEILGLHTVGNNIDQAEDGVDWADLARIADLRVEEVGEDTVDGTVTLKDGSTLRFQLVLTMDVTGRYWLSGAVG